MNSETSKKISSDIVYFIESIVLEYNLEKDFIEGDSLLKKKMENVTDLAERISTKLLYSQAINDYINNNKPLEEILASFKIKKIIEQLINNKINFDDLNILLSQDIKASPEIIKAIEEKIRNNPSIKEIMNNEAEGDKVIVDIEENPKKITSTKSIGNILLKKIN
jgi:hypothetical protein